MTSRANALSNNLQQFLNTFCLKGIKLMLDLSLDGHVNAVKRHLKELGYIIFQVQELKW